MRARWARAGAVVLLLAALGVAVAVPRKHSVKLQWKPSPTAGVDGYNVYRSTSPDGPFAKINGKELVHGLVYVDRHVKNGHHYYYTVRSVQGNLEGADCNHIEVYIP